MKKTMKRSVIAGLVLSTLLPFASLTHAANSGGVKYKITWDDTAERYRVYMLPNMTPSPNYSLQAQVTLKVPHATGDNQFTVADLKSTSVNTWSLDSRHDAPVTGDTNADYLSFGFQLTSPSAFNFKADTELEVFSFQNSATCLGKVSILDNETDVFMKDPNINAGNAFANAGWGANSTDNDYQGNYGTEADCNSTPVVPSKLTAVNDAYAVAIGAPMQTFTPLSNDTIPTTSSTSLSITTNPQYGTAAVLQDAQGNHKITYTPSTTYKGSDTLTYQIKNAAGENSTATINIYASTKITTQKAVPTLSQWAQMLLTLLLAGIAIRYYRKHWGN